MISSLYLNVVAEALDRAPDVPPVALGLTASIDEVYFVNDLQLASLAEAAATTGESREGRVASRIINLIRAGRGGELVEDWPDGHQWIQRVVGPPDLRQVGGNAAQAAWALTAIGAPTLLALSDRSEQQLSVLAPEVLVATEGGLTPVERLQPHGLPTKQAHVILEFSSGTMLDGIPLPRTTRVMLRFGDEPLETDNLFARATKERVPHTTLLSGLATQRDAQTPNATWATELSKNLMAHGGHVHHELSDFGSPQKSIAAVEALPCTSLGMSLSELRSLTRSSTNPAKQAIELASHIQVDRVIVHADDWAMLVTRDISEGQKKALLLGNALAGTRARLGRPGTPTEIKNVLTSLHDAEFSAPTIPPSTQAGPWHSMAVPALYTTNPVATIGLGDTFTAGLLLGDYLWN